MSERERERKTQRKLPNKRVREIEKEKACSSPSQEAAQKHRQTETVCVHKTETVQYSKHSFEYFTCSDTLAG